MSMPFYVSPEQLMKDRADYARKGIARGRSVVVVQYTGGLLFVAENQSKALHKISEIYDRLAFAAVGRYNEFENLRIAGVRLADMRGYSYDRLDVTGRGLANAYAQTLGTIFSSGGEKPYEVEIFVAEVGDTVAGDQIYRLTYEGSVADEHGYAAMGGSADQVAEYLKDHYQDGLALDDALRLAVEALGHDSAQPRAVPGDRLEVAVLDRTRRHPRKFRRLGGAHLTELFGTDDEGDGAATEEPTAVVPGAADPRQADSPALAGAEAPVEPSAAEPAAGASHEGDDPTFVDPSDETGELPDDARGDG
ncbi:MAG: proteasome subunit alpha [Propionibacteriales bacterium]|nr:proteasome subunit alpha [Propionibacteriales bacterium]